MSDLGVRESDASNEIKTTSQSTSQPDFASEVVRLRTLLQAKETEIAKLRAENEQLRAELAHYKPKPPPPSRAQPLSKPLELGKVGTLFDPFVVQVVDKENVILSIGTVWIEAFAPADNLSPTDKWRWQHERDIQSTDSPWKTRNSKKVLTATQRANVWVTGIDTTGMVDGQSVKLPEQFRVTGTKKYTTADGSYRTVFLLQPAEQDTNAPR